jgi:hypothetical protein
MHAKNEIRKAKIGAKYHCGAIACDLLIKASAVVITAYNIEKRSLTPLRS